jgi:hypothetical protein
LIESETETRHAMSRLSPALSVIVVLATAPLSGARAQFVYTLDASGTIASYADAARSSGFSLAPGMRLELPRSSVAALGNVSLFDNGGWAAQGLLSASVFSRAAHGFRGELAATANGIAYGEGGRSAYMIAEGRLHFGGPSSGVWAGGGLGGTGSHSSGSALVLGDAGAWWRRGGLTLTASLTQSRFRSRDAPLTPPTAPGPNVPQLFADTAQAFDYRHRVLDDAVVTGHWESRLLDVDASVGARLRSSSETPLQWATASAAVWVTPGAAIVVRAGRYPESLMQGFPSVRYAELGVRLRSRGRVQPAAILRHAQMARSVSAPVAPPPPPPPPFSVGQSGAADATTRVIRVTEPAAQRVELIADFTDWQPMAMTRTASGVWELAIPIAPGTYRVSVRVDGGAWQAPPGVPPRHDEFGTDAGVIVIE